jgi:hypothetical protein
MKIITVEDYMMGRADFMTLDSAHQTNILKLLQKVNDLLNDAGLERSISSGYRTMKDHQRIYADINKKKKAAGLPEVKVPMGSKHLIGAAIDLADPDGKLDKYCTEDVLKKFDLYMEHPDYTNSAVDPKSKGWCHLQIIPTKNRIFRPY